MVLNEAEKWLTGIRYGWFYWIQNFLWTFTASQNCHYMLSQWISHTRIGEIVPDFLSPDFSLSAPIFAIETLLLIESKWGEVAKKQTAEVIFRKQNKVIVKNYFKIKDGDTADVWWELRTESVQRIFSEHFLMPNISK